MLTHKTVTLGTKCQLSILDLNTGESLSPDGIWAADEGLAWFPDSTHVVFCSLKDYKFYDSQQTKEDKKTGEPNVDNQSKSQLTGEVSKSAKGLYTYCVSDQKVSFLGEGTNPIINTQNNYVLAKGIDGYSSLDLSTKAVTPFYPKNLIGKPITFSPDGKYLLLLTDSRQPNLRSKGAYMASIMDIKNPSKRHIIDYGFRVRRKTHVWLSN